MDDPVNAVDPTGEFAFALPLMFLAGKVLAAGIAGLGVTVASQLTGNPKVKVKVAGKEKETTLNKAALAGVAASKVPDLAVAGALAAPEAAPAVARSASAAKDLAGTAAAKFAQAATKAETVVNNATVNAMGKAAEVAGKISPKVGEAVMNPAVYKAANDALSSYAPTGHPNNPKLVSLVDFMEAGMN